MELYGPKQEELFQKAMDLVLTTTPSALLKKMTDLICTKRPCMTDCCCQGMISGLWRSKLPETVKLAVAGIKLTNDNMKELGDRADAVYKSGLVPAGRMAATIATIASKKSYVPVTPPPAPNPPPQQPGLQDWNPTMPPLAAAALDPSVTMTSLAQQVSELAAVVKKNGNFKKKGANSNQGQNQGSNQRKRAQRHPDNPPENACCCHWQYGKSTWYCCRPWDCPWKEYTTQPPKK